MKKHIVKKIALDEYIKLGGELSNIDLSLAKTTYYDGNRGNGIFSITKDIVKPDNVTGKTYTQLYNVQFTNGKNHIYSGSWIELEVNFVLDEKYF